MDKKLAEIRKILKTPVEIDRKEIILNIKKKYKKDLKGFKYTENTEEIITFKNKYIKYASLSGFLYYGGIFYKTENINGKLYIWLINSTKKSWKIDVDSNYIFYNDMIRTQNDYTRNVFDLFITENNL